MKTRICVVALFALSVAAPSFAQQADRSGRASGDQYTAVTRNNRSAEDKSLNGITWRCYKLDCTAIYGARPEVANAILSCQLLAQWTGGLVSYGKAGAKFTAAQMAECNTPPPPQPPAVKLTPQQQKALTAPPKVTVPLKPPG